MLCLIPNEKAGITVACSKLIDGLLAHLVLPVCSAESRTLRQSVTISQSMIVCLYPGQLFAKH